MVIIKYLLVGDDSVRLTFKYDAQVIAAVKSLSRRRYFPDQKAWFIPLSVFPELEKAVEGIGVLEDESAIHKNDAADPALENLPLPDDIREGKFYVSWITGTRVRLTFRYNVDFIATLREQPSAKYDKETKSWAVDVSDLDALQAYYAPAAFIFMGKNMERLRLSLPQPPLDYKVFPLPEFKTKPFTHQVEGLYYALSHDSCLIGDEQGLGKTWTAINAMVLRKEKAGKCLVVCGVNSIKYNWLSEIERHSSENAALIDAPSAEQRVKKIEKWLMSDAYFGVINIEALRAPSITLRLRTAIEEKKIGGIIADEIHKAKNARSHQGRALRTLNAPYKIGLSGTPINKPEELWNILSWLGVETMEKEYPWMMRYCVMGGYANKQVIAHKNHIELREKLQSVLIRRRKEDVLDLPPKMYQTEFVELSPAQTALYKEGIEELVLNLDEILELSNPLVKTLRLRQITDGLFTDQNPKLARIKEMLEEEIIPSGRKAIIFSNWRKVTDLYFEALSDFHPAYIHGDIPPKERQEAADRFQTDDTCRLIIGTIGAMGTGLTLNAASYVIFVDKSWVPADNEQAEDRAHRIGTKGTVNVISLTAKGTIDEYIEEHIKERKAAFSYFVESETAEAIRTSDIMLDFLRYAKKEEL